MSEHYARVLYIVYAALMLWAAANPKHLWLSMIVGLVVALNILVKPDALVLLIATPIGFIAGAWFLSQQRRAFLAATGVFLATTIVPLSAYMSVFQDRFGTFNLSQATGINLFSHIGHLTVLEGGKHPILKERLKPLLGPYAANYAAKGDYQPNWLAFGSVNESLTRDFGSNNPMREIYKYVAESYPSLSQRYTDQVMREIAIEAILHRPGAYLTYATERAIVLWRVGYNFGFYGLPGATFASNHRDDLSTLRIWLYGMIREPVPPCGDVVAAPAKVASSSLVFLFRAPITSCASAPYDDPVAVALMKRADTVYQTIAQPIEAIFPYLPAIGLVSAIAGGFLICFRPNRSSIETYAFSLFLFLVLFGYTAFHGFINVADVSRMTVNVQDYVAIGSLSFLFCVLTFRPAQATS